MNKNRLVFLATNQNTDSIQDQDWPSRLITVSFSLPVCLQEKHFIIFENSYCYVKPPKSAFATNIKSLVLVLSTPKFGWLGVKPNFKMDWNSRFSRVMQIQYTEVTPFWTFFPSFLFLNQNWLNLPARSPLKFLSKFCCWGVGFNI